MSAPSLSYVCPNGHDFPGMLTVPCAECGASVVCEPVSAGMRLHTLLETAEGDLERVRRQRDQLLEQLHESAREVERLRARLAQL
jgi:hypothetical protein